MWQAISPSAPAPKSHHPRQFQECKLGYKDVLSPFPGKDPISKYREHHKPPPGVRVLEAIWGGWSRDLASFIRRWLRPKPIRKPGVYLRLNCPVFPHLCGNFILMRNFGHLPRFPNRVGKWFFAIHVCQVSSN